MSSGMIKTGCIIMFLIIFATGCAPGGSSIANRDKDIEVSSTATIGDLSEIFAPQAIPVEGYSLIVNLSGTGSSQCPPVIRQYLEQYLLKRLPAKTNVNEIINSPNTAVVYISGKIPASAGKGDYFDLKIEALSGTDTSSLEGGVLLESELKAKGQFSVGMTNLAMAEGPVYIDKLRETTPDKRSGLILAGGRTLNDPVIYLTMKSRNFRLTKQVADRINERFGPTTAMAIMEGQIKLSIPTKYKKQESKFYVLVLSTYLFVNAQDKRIPELITQLTTSENKSQAETYLESIGINAADKLDGLLNSENEEVKFRAARCLLNIGRDEGLDTLRTIAYDKNSKYRTEAIEAISFGARRNDATALLQRLLRDEDANSVLAAYNQLRRLGDSSITRQVIGKKFYLDFVPQAAKQYVYATRSGFPTVVLFGSSLYCRVGAFVQTADSSITINAPENLDKVQIIRQIANAPPIKLECTYSLIDIIQTLSEASPNPGGRTGLNFPYYDTIYVLKLMCDKQAILAQFSAGPLAKIE